MSEANGTPKRDEAAARDAAYDVLGLDAFQRIAVDTIAAEMDEPLGMPAPGSADEARLISIGRVVSSAWWPWLDPPDEGLVT